LIFDYKYILIESCKAFERRHTKEGIFDMQSRGKRKKT